MNLNTDLETGLLGVRSFLLWTALAEALEAALRARLGRRGRRHVWIAVTEALEVSLRARLGRRGRRQILTAVIEA